MSESNSMEQEDQVSPKHVMKRRLLGRPKEGMVSAKSILARYRSTAIPDA
jgi:hypothetical protein